MGGLQRIGEHHQIFHLFVNHLVAKIAYSQPFIR